MAYSTVMVRRGLALALAAVVVGCSTPNDDAYEEPNEVRRFVVQGAEVWARSGLVDLPEHATVVEISTTIIDNGSGPNACLGTVLDSLPPQCSGPMVAGLTLDPSWAESLGPVTWGDRTIVVDWPPVDGALTLRSDRSAAALAWPDQPRPSLPEDCVGRDDLLGPDVLGQWAEAHPDRAAIVFVGRDETVGVLQVKGDLAVARDEISTATHEPCLVEVEFSSSELQAAQDAVGSHFTDGTYVLGSGSGNIFNRLDVTVAVPDRATIRRLVESVGDPEILRISGAATMLEGTD